MSERDEGVLPVRKPVPGGEWILSVRFEVDGVVEGLPFEMRYVDSVLAPCPENVVRLVCGRLQEFGLKRASLIRAARRR